MNLIIFLFCLIFHVLLVSAEYNGTEIDFNKTDTVFLPKKLIYLYQSITPAEFINDLDDYNNLNRGNVQGKCFKYAKYIKIPVKCKYVMNFLNLRGRNWKEIPYNYNFDPYSPVYGINKHKTQDQYENVYDDDGLKTLNSELLPYMGEYIDIITNYRVQISFSEAGVLPKNSQFWIGDGCRNWTKGNKKWRGQTGYSDYQLNFLRETEAICTKKYESLCLCIT